MAQNIKLKRSSVPGKIPTTAQLQAGEIAINTADGKLYFERDDASIQTIVTTNSVITGSLNINGPVTASFFSGNGSQITGVVSSSFATTAATASFIAGYAKIGIAPSGSRIAIWEDSTSIKGDSGFLYTDNSLIVNNGRTLRGGTQSWSTGTISFKIAAPVSAYGAFVTYTIFRDDASRSAFRAGTITAAWNKAGTSVVLNETTTTDFGTIPAIVSNVALSGGVMFVTFTQTSGLTFGVNCSINVMGL